MDSPDDKDTAIEFIVCDIRDDITNHCLMIGRITSILMRRVDVTDLNVLGNNTHTDLKFT